MLDHLSPKGLAWLLGSLVVGFLAFAAVSLAGSAVVVDETGGVRSAAITNSGGSEQPLHRLWNGYFYTIPQFEGTIEVRCRDGSRISWGYVTPAADAKIRVVGDTPCAKVVEAD